MFVMQHSDIHTPKSGLFHLTGQPNSQMGRAKVMDGIIPGAIFLGTSTVDGYTGERES
jgi:hypothetical protein